MHILLSENGKDSASVLERSAKYSTTLTEN